MKGKIEDIGKWQSGRGFFFDLVGGGSFFVTTSDNPTQFEQSFQIGDEIEFDVDTSDKIKCKPHAHKLRLVLREKKPHYCIYLCQMCRRCMDCGRWHD